MKDILLVLTFLMILGGAVIVYQHVTGQQAQVAEQPAHIDLRHEPQEQTSVIQYPLPEHRPTTQNELMPDVETESEQAEETGIPKQVETMPPLPVLDESDNQLLEALSTIVENKALRSFFNMNEIVRRFVVTIDKPDSPGPAPGAPRSFRGGSPPAPPATQRSRERRRL